MANEKDGARMQTGGAVDTLTAPSVPHTPIPWQQHTLLVEDATHNLVASCTRWERAPMPEVAAANAAFIVRACNVHQELVDALKAIQGWICNSRLIDPNDPIAHPAFVKANNAVVVALAKAEGR